jgi:hypothetical protein
MKKTTCITIAAFALMPFSLCANAAETSVQSGAVSPTCSLVVKDGSLPSGADLTPSLVTNDSEVDAGKISTICNGVGSTLKVELIAGVHPAQLNLTEQFQLTKGTGAYPANPASSFSANPYNKINLTNTYSDAASTIRVRAKVFVPNAQNLVSGTYTVNIRATVTP